MGCSPPVSSMHGILQSRILEWVVILFSRGSSQPRNQTQVSCIKGRFFFAIWATREAHIPDHHKVILPYLIIYYHLLFLTFPCLSPNVKCSGRCNINQNITLFKMFAVSLRVSVLFTNIMEYRLYACMLTWVVFNSWHLHELQPTRSSIHGISRVRNIGVGYRYLHQGILPTQGSNLHLLCFLHW